MKLLWFPLIKYWIRQATAFDLTQGQPWLVNALAKEVGKTILGFAVRVQACYLRFFRQPYLQSGIFAEAIFLQDTRGAVRG